MGGTQKRRKKRTLFDNDIYFTVLINWNLIHATYTNKKREEKTYTHKQIWHRNRNRLKLKSKEHPCTHLHLNIKRMKIKKKRHYIFYFFLFVWFILYKFFHCCCKKKAYDIKLKYKPLSLYSSNWCNTLSRTLQWSKQHILLFDFLFNERHTQKQ